MKYTVIENVQRDNRSEDGRKRMRGEKKRGWETWRD